MTINEIARFIALEAFEHEAMLQTTAPGAEGARR